MNPGGKDQKSGEMGLRIKAKIGNTKRKRRTLLLGKVSLFTATLSGEEEREQGSGKKDSFGKHFP